ncbi:type I methionyl aminopeptidase [Candidatus Woesebacteria bacterium]|nr:type I methionyl aminopeptidase [Candidatus Woesebacteria bacterium]
MSKIYLKSPEEIQAMKEGGAILRAMFEELVPTVKAGMTTNKINDFAEHFFKNKGVAASFKTVPGYSWATCTTINEQAVHTPPSERQLTEGDILTIDAGVLHKGFHTDSAVTIAIGTIPKETQRFLDVGKQTLEKVLTFFKPGTYLGKPAQFIQHEIEKAGYFILKELTGHGVGQELHEDPYVFNFLHKPINKTVKIKPGMTLAVEIIYSTGTEDIAYEGSEEWSIITADRSLSACFEKTIAITEKQTFILT